MAKLDELRERYMRDPDAAIAAAAYATVEVNGMEPLEQLTTLAERASEMGWPDCNVAFREGLFILVSEGEDYLLPYHRPDDRAAPVVVVPECNPEVAARLRAPAHLRSNVIRLDSTVPTTTVDLRQVWSVGLNEQQMAEAITKAVVEAAQNSGWPPTSIATFDYDVMADHYQIVLSDGRGHHIDFTITTLDDTITIGPYDPKGGLVMVGNPPLSGPLAEALAPSTPATRKRKKVFTGQRLVLRGIVSDPRKIMASVREVLNEAGWPSSARVSMEMLDNDDEDGDVEYRIKAGSTSVAVQVSYSAPPGEDATTVIVIPAYATAKS